MPRHRLWTLGVVLLALTLSACQRDGALEPQATLETAAATVLHAQLLPENEVHQVDSSASGRATAVLQGNRLRVTGTFQGLSSPLLPIAGTPGHIHEAPVGQNGPVAFLLDVKANRAGGGTFSLVTTLSDEDVAEFLVGNYYINLHTEAFPAGELRGQLFPNERPLQVTSTLSGANEVPAVQTSASGTVRMTLNGFAVSVTGRFEGLQGDLRPIAGTPGHIHEAPAGQNGPVVFLLDIQSADARSGTFSFRSTLTDEQRVGFRSGEYYVNIHSNAFPSGELRAQLE